MSIVEPSKTEKELILQAQRSSSEQELRYLSKNSFSNVRRCVAKNTNTPRDIIDILAFDPVSNVVYVALMNPKCSVKRKNQTVISRCIVCPKDESTYHYECQNCDCEQSLI